MVFVGALVVRGQLAVGLVVLAAIFVPMERVFALNNQPIFRKGWRTDAVHFVVNNLLTTLLLIVAVVTAGAVLTAVVPGSLRAAVAHQPVPLQVGEAFLLAEVFGYWGHRAAHTVPWLWKFHRVHHSIREMDWLAAGRLHPVDQAFIRSCAVLPIVALGFARGALGAFVAFTTLQAIFVHANVRFRLGPCVGWCPLRSSIIGTIPPTPPCTTATSPESFRGSTCSSARFICRRARSRQPMGSPRIHPTATSPSWPGRSSRRLRADPSRSGFPSEGGQPTQPTFQSAPVARRKPEPSPVHDHTAREAIRVGGGTGSARMVRTGGVELGRADGVDRVLVEVISATEGIGEMGDRPANHLLERDFEPVTV